MCERITSSGSYDEALCIISEYVEITSIDEYEEETEEMGNGDDVNGILIYRNGDRRYGRIVYRLSADNSQKEADKEIERLNKRAC